MVLSEEAEAQVYKIAKTRNLAKGDILIREGEKVNKSFFVLDGCIRSFSNNNTGREHTLQFAIKDWWVSDFTALYNNSIASLTVECIKEAKVIEFNTDDLNEIYHLFPEFERYQRKNLERYAMNLNHRILNQLQLSASDRYDLFLKQYADIEQYISNYHIASYLGITQQSLSRIRLEKTKKKESDS
ncbi:hypothetical protein NH26_24065 [Flammeovirga pacifica]|uniref:Cyclic nucleotide-binding domain-containing protein n=1 Tax=Flammeovirga pacifica TaxID=915059 RepID=A0A1S1YVD8_FLAPC|nr:hypothetical protein NH26_24065 [Flammeovirga pacifica]